MGLLQNEIFQHLYRPKNFAEFISHAIPVKYLKLP